MSKKHLLIGFVLVLGVFLLWRMVRPMNIFVVGDSFAYPIQTDVPAGLVGLRAEQCGVCHQEIYQEWSQSMHAQAWTEEYFVADKAFEKDPEVCKGCHIQLERQRSEKIVAYKDADRLYPITQPNPDFDPLLQKEGVTCAVCHVREGRIIGPYPPEGAPQPVDVKPEFLSQTMPCQMCHVVSGERWDMFYRRPPCGTLSEIGETGLKADCVGCHLPRVTRPMAQGGPVRTGGRHLFQGGHHPSQVKGALTVELETMQRGEEIRLRTTLTNTGAHHYFPTGTPDRHLTLTFTLLDEGREIRSTTHTMKRTILWRPFIVDLMDSRLPYQSPRTFVFPFKASAQPQQVRVEVSYHLLEEARRKRIGYQNTQPIAYPLFQETVQIRPEGGDKKLLGGPGGTLPPGGVQGQRPW